MKLRRKAEADKRHADAVARYRVDTLHSARLSETTENGVPSTYPAPREGGEEVVSIPVRDIGNDEPDGSHLTDGGLNTRE